MVAAVSETAAAGGGDESVPGRGGATAGGRAECKLNQGPIGEYFARYLQIRGLYENRQGLICKYLLRDHCSRSQIGVILQMFQAGVLASGEYLLWPATSPSPSAMRSQQSSVI